MNKYNKALNYFLERVIQEKRRTGGQWDWVYEYLGQTNEFAEILKAEVKEKFSLQEWEYNILYQKLHEDKYITSAMEPTFLGYNFIEDGGYIKQRKIKITYLWAKRLEIIALCFGSVMAGTFACLSYVSDAKVENLERLNKSLIIREQQQLEQINLLIPQEQQSLYQFNSLRDSLRSAKGK